MKGVWWSELRGAAKMTSALIGQLSRRGGWPFPVLVGGAATAGMIELVYVLECLETIPSGSLWESPAGLMPIIGLPCTVAIPWLFATLCKRIGPSLSYEHESRQDSTATEQGSDNDRATKRRQAIVESIAVLSVGSVSGVFVLATVWMERAVTQVGLYQLLAGVAMLCTIAIGVRHLIYAEQQLDETKKQRDETKAQSEEIGEGLEYLGNAFGELQGTLNAVSARLEKLTDRVPEQQQLTTSVAHEGDKLSRSDLVPIARSLKHAAWIVVAIIALVLVGIVSIIGNLTLNGGQ